jgi:hypothetical protein
MRDIYEAGRSCCGCGGRTCYKTPSCQFLRRWFHNAHNDISPVYPHFSIGFFRGVYPGTHAALHTIARLPSASYPSTSLQRGIL